MPGFYDQLEQKIAKYGGEDAAYKDKLKREIRESLGYSNYVSQRNAALGKPIDVSMLKGNITPAGVKQLVGGEMDIKNKEVDTYQTMADKTDIAAEGIAADKLAEMKAARAKAEAEAKALKESLQYKPTNWAESEIVNYMKTAPKNEDGTMMTREQLKERLTGQLTGEGVFEGVTPQMIEQRINEWIPEDYESKATYYQARAIGFTKGEAEEAQLYRDYTEDKLSPEIRKTIDMMYPAWSTEAKEQEAKLNVAQQASETVKDEFGERPKYNLIELINNNPDVTPTETARLMTNAMEGSVGNSIHSQFYDSRKSKVQEIIQKGNYDELMETDEYKKLKTNLVADYRQYGFDEKRIEDIIYNVLHGLK